MKRFTKLFAILLVVACLFTACSGTKTYGKHNGDVTIVYTNDVHTYINNTGKDDDGNPVKLLTYGKVAALRNDLVEAGENVLLVDAGDHSQGTAFGGMDEGKSIIKIMNAAGYQLATLGNHEFDYGIFRAFAIMDEAQFPYISANFYTVADNKPVLPASEILEVNGVKVAFIGISTPETITKSTPVYFQDENGNYVYNFAAGEDGKALYDSVQKAIDAVAGKADYIIALGHLGVDPSSEPYTSRELIANTTGLDAFIDGHSHSTIEREEVLDKAGNTVVLTQTGSYLSAIGKMTIKSGEITTELVTEYENTDETVDAVAQEWIDSVNKQLGEQIAVFDTDFFINTTDGRTRLIRRMETNMGDLVADGYYYYFNEVEGLNCDVAIANGGGIRADVKAGDVSYNTTKTIQPFGNVVCLVEVSGQELLDMLEFSNYLVGVSKDDGTPAEFGGYMHTAGVTFTVNTAVESGVKLTDDKMFDGIEGEYRVSDVKVYNRATGAYEDLDLAKMYTLAGTNYALRNSGDGYTMLSKSTLVKDYVGEDYLIAAAYLKAFATGDDGFAHVSTANSPLASYPGYLLDYENPLGSGRVTVVAAE